VLHAMRLALLQPGAFKWARMMASISDVEMRGPCRMLVLVAILRAAMCGEFMTAPPCLGIWMFIDSEGDAR